MVIKKTTTEFYNVSVNIFKTKGILNSKETHTKSKKPHVVDSKFMTKFPNVPEMRSHVRSQDCNVSGARQCELVLRLPFLGGAQGRPEMCTFPSPWSHCRVIRLSGGYNQAEQESYEGLLVIKLFQIIKVNESS